MPTDDNRDQVVRYYAKTESRFGYRMLLGGSKHFGLYRHGDNPWRWRLALRRMEDRLAEELALPPGSYVLDAGCGVGDVAIRLAAMHGLNIAGIDLLPGHVAEAQQRAKRRGVVEHVAFRQMDYASLEFPDRAFDGCYTMETLVHAYDAEAVLKEFWRVLRPGGHLVLFEYSRESDRKMPQAAAEAFKYVNHVAAMPSYQRFEYGTLEGLLAEAGFAAITVKDITAGILPMLWSFALVGGLPYRVARACRRPDKLINAMSAVESWRYRRYFRYSIFGARKPS